MRCGEYQRRNHCQLNCPNAATPEELTRLAKICDPVVEKGPDRFTIEELAREDFHTIDTIRNAIRKGKLEAESAMVTKDIRRRVWLISRAAWAKYKARYTGRDTTKEPNVYTVEELSIKEGVSYGSIIAAILRGSLYAERVKIKIKGKNRLRRVHLISSEAWGKYQGSKKRKVFTEAFKRETVQRSDGDKTKTLSMHAQELGISLSQLHKWRRQSSR
jgi:Transposase